MSVIEPSTKCFISIIYARKCNDSHGLHLYYLCQEVYEPTWITSLLFMPRSAQTNIDYISIIYVRKCTNQHGLHLYYLCQEVHRPTWIKSLLSMSGSAQTNMD